MYPQTVLEIIGSTIFVVMLYATALLLPQKNRKLSLLMASSITVFVLAFFVIRPYWVDYQVSKKTEQLNHYLEDKYPNQRWQFSRDIGRNYNPYHVNVEFENEKGWTYSYSLSNELCQSSWSPPEGKSPSEGKHFEKSCD